MLSTNQSLRQERYRVIQPLSADGSEGLYAAFDTQTETDVTIREFCEPPGKVLATGQLSAARSRFDEAARTVGALRHDSLIPVVDFFSEVEGHYLVSEKSEGGSLGDFLAKKKSPFPVGDAARWTDRLLDALIYLHGQPQPQFHFGISPHRINLTPRGQVFFHASDFVRPGDRPDEGSAIVYQPLEQIWSNLDLASKKVIVTSYDERAEKRLEEEPDAQSDVYSLAATFYELLTAKLPADALTRSIELLDGNPDPLKPPHELNPSVPPEVSEVVMRALAIRREDRYSSAAIVRQFLRGAFTRYRERQAAATPVARAVAAPAATPVVPVAEVRPAAVPSTIPVAMPANVEAVETKPPEPVPAVVVNAPVVAPVDSPVVEKVPEVVPESAVSQTPTADDLTAMKFEGDEFSTLFATPPPSGGMFKKMAAGVIAVAILGGAGFGVWKMQSGGGAAPEPIATQNLAAPAAEPTPAAIQPETATSSMPVVDPTPVTSAENAAPAPSPAIEPATERQPAPAVNEKPAETPSARPKNIAVPQTAEVKKPTPQPAKPATPKKVTLDDLLTDN